MPYTCAICGKTTDDPTGWGRAQVVWTHYVSAQPSVTADEDFAVYDFDTDACLATMKARIATGTS